MIALQPSVAEPERRRDDLPRDARSRERGPEGGRADGVGAGRRRGSGHEQPLPLVEIRGRERRSPPVPDHVRLPVLTWDVARWASVSLSHVWPSVSS